MVTYQEELKLLTKKINARKAMLEAEAKAEAKAKADAIKSPFPYNRDDGTGLRIIS